MSDSCSTCKRYKHACHCAEIEAVAGPLRAKVERLKAELKDWIARGAEASVVIDSYGEASHALVLLAKAKGATQEEIDAAWFAPATEKE